MEPVEVPDAETPSSAELQKQLEALHGKDADLVSERRDIQHAKGDLESARKRYETYTNLCAELARYETEPKDVRAQIDETQEKLRHLERRETELSEVQKQGEKRQRFEQEAAELEAALGEKPQAPERSSEAWHFEMEQAREKGEAARKELAELQQSTVETVCPTCKRPYDNEEELRAAEERRAARIDELARELELHKAAYIKARQGCDAARAEETAVSAYIEQQNELVTLHARIEALAPAPDPAEIKQIRRDIDGARMFLKSLELRRDEFDEYQRLKERLDGMGEVAEPADGAELDNRLEWVNQRLDELRGAVAELIPRIDERREQEQQRRSALDHNEHVKKHNQKLDAEGKDIQKHLKDLRTEQEVLHHWEAALGQKGFRLKAIQEFLGLLNTRMQVYSTYLSESRITCRFYLTEDDKIDYQIQDSDKEAAFRLWSEGEKSRIKLACLFAVIDLLETIGGVQVNLLFLDEIFGTLDEQGRDGLFNLLADLRNQGKSVFTIAHTPVANPALFDSVVEARKEHGVSVLEII
jgi:exonuclease SbcC